MSVELCSRSLRELARRMLRSRGVIIRLPMEIVADENLAIQISDLAPNLYFGIEFKFNPEEEIIVTNIGGFGGVIGPNIPDESEVWIPMDLQIGFDQLNSQLMSLASAGYPGCTGCGGPDDETPWDEISIRKLFGKQSDD